MLDADFNFLIILFIFLFLIVNILVIIVVPWPCFVQEKSRVERQDPQKDPVFSPRSAYPGKLFFRSEVRLIEVMDSH